ncbi:MAG: VWA domain-containing protein, partial [Akkermansiaceae bacterium]|nr:VWA domain-containing protein [Akkermansiaceae bacterium]
MSQIEFTYPWLLLLPVLVFLAWRCPHLQLQRPIRAIALICLLLVLCKPAIPSRWGGMDLYVLLDRSASTGGLVERQRREWRNLLEDARPAYRDRLHFIDFAEDAVPSLDGGGSELALSRRDQTRIPLAVEYALARQDSRRPTRLLVMTDGYSTEPMGITASRLSAMGIPMDYRLIEQATSIDYRITGFDGPTRVQAGEAFLLRARVAGFGSKDGEEIPITLLRDGKTLVQSSLTIHDGSGTIEWADRIDSGGSHRYRVQIQPEQDAHHGNNHAETWLEISAGPRILIVSRHPDDPLATAFKGQGLETDLRTEPSKVTPADLTGAKAVVLHNVPAHDLDPDFLNSLNFFVRHQGGGLLMVGGRHSFGAGGYFQSSIDELLPVSMELKADHRKLALAMCIVLDRSGSMSAAAGGGAGGAAVTKMDLANQGAATAIELLGQLDSVSVLAVDSSPHVMVPLTRLGKQRNDIVGRVLKIQSAGGGIYVYEGLKGAATQLAKATSGTRHIILFADACDAVQPGKYRELIAKLVAEGTTISVVGLGKDTDPDAGLL